MSRLSQALKNFRPSFKINLQFGGRKTEVKRPVGRPPKESIKMKSWYKSKGKLGAIIYGITAIIEGVLPSFGVDIQIPGFIFTALETFGISLSAYGIRAAIK